VLLLTLVDVEQMLWMLFNVNWGVHGMSIAADAA